MQERCRRSRSERDVITEESNLTEFEDGAQEPQPRNVGSICPEDEKGKEMDPLLELPERNVTLLISLFYPSETHVRLLNYRMK